MFSNSSKNSFSDCFSCVIIFLKKKISIFNLALSYIQKQIQSSSPQWKSSVYLLIRLWLLKNLLKWNALAVQKKSIKINDWVKHPDELFTRLSASTRLYCHVWIYFKYHILIFVKEQDAEWGHLFWHTARLGNSRNDPHGPHYTLDGSMIGWLQRLGRKRENTG